MRRSYPAARRGGKSAAREDWARYRRPVLLELGDALGPRLRHGQRFGQIDGLLIEGPPDDGVAGGFAETQLEVQKRQMQFGAGHRRQLAQGTAWQVEVVMFDELVVTGSGEIGGEFAFAAVRLDDADRRGRN